MPTATKKERELLVIVPCLNEAENVGPLLAGLAPTAWDVLLIDDGSADDTARRAEAAGVAVVRHPMNLGVGPAVQTGLRYAHRAGYARVLRLDADLQHPPEQAQKLVTLMDETGADVVIGSRYAPGAKGGYRSTLLRRLGKSWLSLLGKLFTGLWVHDPTSGFQLFSRSAIAFLADEYPARYPEPEALVLLLRNGFRIHEAPVEMAERLHGTSSITFFNAAQYMLLAGTGMLFARLRRKVVR